MFMFGGQELTSACIEQLVRECETCQSVRNNFSLTLLHPWLWPDTPWKRLQVDFAGPFQGTMFMIIVDAHSKWLEVVPLSTTTTEKTLYVLCSMIARQITCTTCHRQWATIHFIRV